MGISLWQVLIVVALVILLFGRGKISELMGDVAKGINSFKKGLSDGEGDADTKSVTNDESQKIGGASPRKDGDEAAKS